jgi:micrococcal nuclease
MRVDRRPRQSNQLGTRLSRVSRLSYGSVMKPSYLTVLFLVSSACAGEYSARVVGITDGDTLTVLTAQKTQVKIRLAGIDAPQSGQDFGTRAKQGVSDLAFGKTVTIIEGDTDR